MNTYRRLLCDWLESNGGYSRSTHDRVPVAFNVKVYGRVPRDIEDAIDMAEWRPRMKQLARAFAAEDVDLLDWNAEVAYDWAIEDAREWLRGDVKGTTYGTIGPGTARRFGLPYERFPRKYKRRTTEPAYYPAAKPGWVLADPYLALEVSAKFSFYGRSGGYIGLDEFEGRKLRGYSACGLAREIREDDRGEYGNEWCHHLLAMCYEWERFFNPTAATKEIRHQMIESFTRELEQAREHKRQQNKERNERAYWAARGVITATAGVAA